MSIVHDFRRAGGVSSQQAAQTRPLRFWNESSKSKTASNAPPLLTVTNAG